jgi:hypothetical protein|tara:strand:+ start:184 stop:549 length:366 start_codon:yes stop_codon:yes gene_type:complete
MFDHHRHERVSQAELFSHLLTKSEEMADLQLERVRPSISNLVLGAIVVAAKELESGLSEEEEQSLQSHVRDYLDYMTANLSILARDKKLQPETIAGMAETLTFNDFRAKYPEPGQYTAETE